jgi:SEC-C motif-containing protein
MGTKLSACPCGGGDYAACCSPYHNGAPAPDAERMMRSRYSAYVIKLEDYLLATWHPNTRPAAIEFGDEKWLGLEVKRHLQSDSNHATVEFVARYKIAGRAYRLHEISRFVLEGGRWFYLDGEFRG